MKKVLSLTGGGMRGVISQVFLIELERRLGKPLAEVFDLVAGTSTGAINAALVCTPKNVSAAAAQDFYFESGPKIFSSNLLRKISTTFGAASPKYTGKTLYTELQACLGMSTMSQTRTRLLIPTVDADKVAPVFIKSWEPYWKDFPLWQAAAASSSAQTYFPTAKFMYGGSEHAFIDGGNHSNSPVASAAYEASKLWPNEELLIVSIGTGREIVPKPLPSGGLLQWAPLVFSTVSELQMDVADYFVDNWGPGLTRYHFDVTALRFPDLDVCRRNILIFLTGLADAIVLKDSAKLDAVCAKLAK